MQLLTRSLTDAAGQVIDANADGVPDTPAAGLLRRGAHQTREM